MTGESYFSLLKVPPACVHSNQHGLHKFFSNCTEAFIDTRLLSNSIKMQVKLITSHTLHYGSPKGTLEEKKSSEKCYFVRTNYYFEGTK